jgi:hypothetical protein
MRSFRCGRKIILPSTAAIKHQVKLRMSKPANKAEDDATSAEAGIALRSVAVPPTDSYRGSRRDQITSSILHDSAGGDFGHTV